MDTNNIFSAKFKAKSDQELFNILLHNEKYVPNALHAALNEIQLRGILDNGIDPTDLERINEVRQHLLAEEENHKAQLKEKAHQAHLDVTLPKTHLYDLVGYYSFSILALISLSFPYFNLEFFGIWCVSSMVFFIPLWQGNILAKNEKAKRSIHFKERLIYAFAMTLYIYLRAYFIKDDLSFSFFFLGIFVFIIVLIESGIFSLFFFLFTIKRLAGANWYFLNRFRIFIPIAMICLMALVVMEEGWFISPNKIVWDDTRTFTTNDFRGYADLFSEYDAAINSYLDFEFNVKDELVRLEAVSRTDISWMNPWDRDSYFLLQHEKYHFDLTEAIARMARKAVLDTLKAGSDRKGVELIISRHHQLRREWQNQYDAETDHSVISDMQGYWQFKIDSLLFELDPYWTSDVLQKRVPLDTVKYFRHIRMNGKGELIGSYPILTGEENYTDHYRFFYDEQGGLYQIGHYSMGRRSAGGQYKAAIIKITNDGTNERWDFFDQDGQLIDTPYRFASFTKKKSSGKVYYTFFDKKGRRVKHKNGYYGKVCYIDAKGREIEKRFFDISNNPTQTNHGVHIVRLSYTENEGIADFAVSSRNYNLNGQAVNDSDGAFEYTYNRDEHGNYLSEVSRDRFGTIVCSDKLGTIHRKYNELGYCIEYLQQDQDEQLHEFRDKQARITWSYDRYGNENRVSTYNANNVLVADEKRVASYYYKYDSARNLLSYAAYGTGDELIFTHGYGKEIYEYDTLGNVVLVKNLNGYDYPVRSKASSAIYAINRDSSNSILDYLYYNKDMEPDTCDDGSHRIHEVYDSRNNLLERSFYGLNDQLVPVEQDVAMFRFAYDARNNKIESRFYNVDLKLAHANQGVPINRYTYSDDNQMIQRTYYDSLDQLARFDGSALIKFVYDERGNEIEAWHYDTHKMLIDSGVAIIKNKYDRKGNIVETRNYDHHQKLIQSKPAIVSTKYNKYDEIIEEKYFNDLGLPTVFEDSVHIYQYRYDEQNNYIGRSYFGVDGKLIEVDGIAKIVQETDRRGNTISEMYLDRFEDLTKDEEGVARQWVEYDAYDRIIYQRFTDENNQPTKRTGYYSAIKFYRNPSGHIIRQEYYNEEDELAIDADSIAIYVHDYDRNGQYTTTKYKMEAALKLLSEGSNSAE